MISKAVIKEGRKVQLRGILNVFEIKRLAT